MLAKPIATFFHSKQNFLCLICSLRRTMIRNKEDDKEDDPKLGFKSSQGIRELDKIFHHLIFGQVIN